MRILLAMPIHHISIEVYPFDVCLIVGEKNRKVREWVNGNTTIGDVDACMQMLKWKGKHQLAMYVIYGVNKASFIRLRGMPNTAGDWAVLAHELLHCTCQIMREVGIPLTFDSEEAYTYLIQYLTRKVYEVLGTTNGA